MADETQQTDDAQASPEPSEKTDSTEPETFYSPVRGERVDAKTIYEDSLKLASENTKLQQQRAQDGPTEPNADVTEQSGYDAAQLEEAKKALGLDKYTDRDSVEKLLETKLAERDFNQKMDSSLNNLEGKYAGKGDYSEIPKFDRVEVLDYMRRTNIGDPEVAFEQLHKGDFIDYYAKQSQKKTAAGDSSDAAAEPETDLKSLAQAIAAADGNTNTIAEVLKKHNATNIGMTK